MTIGIRSIAIVFYYYYRWKLYKFLFSRLLPVCVICLMWEHRTSIVILINLFQRRRRRRFIKMVQLNSFSFQFLHNISFHSKFVSQNWLIFVMLPILLASTAVNAYKILVLGPINGKSHFLYVSSFVKALQSRGHEVTFLTSNSLMHLKLANYTEILIDPPLDLLSKCNSNTEQKLYHKFLFFF